MKKTIAVIIISLNVLVSFSQDANIKSSKNFKSDSIINAVVSSINKDSIEYIIRSLENFGTRYVYAPNRKRIADWIKQKYIGYGYENTRIDSFTKYASGEETWHYNIIARLEGTINPEKFYIIGGHWDSYSSGDPTVQAPGADDNASGTAAAMEIARVMKQLNYQPEASIEFIAFDAEELMYVDAPDNYGSFDYATKAFESGMDIQLMINNDMIANEMDDIWELGIEGYILADWAASLAEIYIAEYTEIDFLNRMSSIPFADSYPFGLYNYPTIYFMEEDFSPYYHSPNDLTDNVNLEYCQDVVKLSASLLTHYTLVPFQTDTLILSHGAGGTSFVVSWKPVYNADIEGYNVYLFDEVGELIGSDFTSDTSHIVSGLTEGDTYIIGISAVDFDGNEGYMVTEEKTLFNFAFDEGIAIIDDSYGGILNPTDEEIDSFYEILLSNYQHTNLDINDLESNDFKDIGHYSSIIWHINMEQSGFIKNWLFVLSDYLDNGGNLLITADKIAFALGDEELYNRMIYYENNEFIHDYLKIDSSYLKTLSLFNGAYAELEIFPYLSLDSTKIESEDDYHIKLITQAIFPGENAEAIYFYDTEFDSTSNFGMMKHMPVGVLNDGENYKTLSLGFPLYYMDLYQSKNFIDAALQHIFGESTNPVNHILNYDDKLTLWPNPARSELYYIVADEFQKIEKIKIFSLTGRLFVEYQHSCKPVNKLNIQNLPSGMYFIIFEGDFFSHSSKFIKID